MSNNKNKNKMLLRQQQPSMASHSISLLFVLLSISIITYNGWTVNAFAGVPLRGKWISRRVSGVSLMMTMGNDDDDLQQSQLQKPTMEPGDTVICKRNVPTMGIYENKAYELQSIYAQAFQESTQKMEQIPLTNLEADSIPPGYDRYITLYNPSYHKTGQPVIVTPEEVGLVSVRSELVTSMWLAIPGFFWVFVAANFYNIYHERTGGSFSDAFWGR
mmetsp:Transcript_30594/g.50525  ORF Transcript_30594/g.50525 Transcript_30594/m.50525 type:complete len:217 (+) Transcript_30594:1-651(+)